jgi:hypothetical protein
MSSVEIQIRRLIWWGIFVLDRYISAWQGRPCGIHEDDFDTKFPDDSPQGTRDISLSCFVQVIRLCTFLYHLDYIVICLSFELSRFLVLIITFPLFIWTALIQGRIHRAFYSVGSPEPAWEDLHEFERHLDGWEAQVPDFLAVRQGVRLPVVVIMMHAQFWNCKILLHRLLYAFSSLPSTSTSTSTPSTRLITHFVYLNPTSITPSTPPETRRNNSSLLAATSAAVAIANLLEHFTSSYSASFAPPFFNYFAFTATIMHLFNRSMYPLLFSPSALTHCTDCCRKMSTIWSSAGRTLHIIEGVDREVDNTMPVGVNLSFPGANGSAAAAAPSMTTGMTVPEKDKDRENDGNCDDPYYFTSWPSPIVDPDWLSLETWRAGGSEDMMGGGSSSSTTGYFQ